MARPVHVVYGGAHLFTSGTLDKLGARARDAMEQWGEGFARALGIDDDHADEVVARVRRKLAEQPVESFCIDFEDGYGPRSDQEEDEEATRAAKELAATKTDAAIGIRIKPLSGQADRGTRTLASFLTTLVEAGGVPERFTVTLPKVTSDNEIGVLKRTLERLEIVLGIQDPIGIELMIETPQALLDAKGVVPIRSIAESAGDRVVCVHLGAYDLTSELGVTAVDQRLDHPFCDLARMLLQMSLAGTSIAVSDGATTLLPIPPKDASRADALAAVHRAWALHARNVRRAIDVGIWQGWDLHPAQLPARYGALFAHFISRRAEMKARQRTFQENAERASRVGQTFDDAATGRGLENFFRRGVACGALEGETTENVSPATQAK
jgi:citrate lyase beta subunit